MSEDFDNPEPIEGLAQYAFCDWLANVEKN